MSTPQDVARALPDYEIGHEMGRGQFGIVWSGRHRQLRREVAIKQLAVPQTDTAEHGASFSREARILAQIDHPHVVAVHDYREQGDLRVFVMELLTGGTFEERRAAGMSVETAIASTLAAASGLQDAHRHGVLHRDVKPENLMFDHRGTLKVTDFGIARDDPATATAMNPTHAGAFFGTPAFMAPEQAGHALAEGWPPIDAAADQYSLAAVLYEALTGQLTHDSGGGSVALCTRRMNEEARPLRDLAPTVPAEIEAVAMKALARDPSKRYATVEDFAVALGSAACSSLGPDWLGRSEVQLRDAGAILDAARGRGGGPLTLDVQPHVPRGRPRLMISTFAIALIVALASFVFLTRHDSPAPNGLHGSPIARFTNLPRRLTKAWSFVTGGGVFSSPAVSGDVVVVGSDDGSVYALDATTGKLRWKRTTGGPVRSSPVIAGGRVFVGSNDGSLYALDLTTGSVVWKAPIGYEIVSSPAVAGGVVVVGSDRLYAFDAATGASRWNFTPGKPIVSSPAIARGTVVVGSNDARVCGIDLSTGKERWHFPTGAGIQSSPAIADGVAYVGGLDGNLYAINISNGVSAWATDLGSPVKSSPVVSSGRVFVGTDAGRLDSIAVVGGKLQWSFNASDRVDSSPTVVGDIVAVGSDDNNVYAVASRTGTLEGAYQTSGAVLSSPHAVGSNIAVGSNDNKIYEISGLGARGS